MTQHNDKKISIYYALFGVFVLLCAVMAIWVSVEAIFLPEAYVERVVK